ncbi:MAG TPA: hypothetical protein VF292_03000 [Rhodanobacteraceae bacterium]
MNPPTINANRQAVAAIVADMRDLYTLVSGPDGFVAPVAKKTADACAALRDLIKVGAGDPEQAGGVSGIDTPTGRGAVVPRGTLAPDLANHLRATLGDVPALLYGAWLSLTRYDLEPVPPWMHLEEAAWRLADANLILQSASEDPALSQLRVTVDNPTLPFVPNPAWEQNAAATPVQLPPDLVRMNEKLEPLFRAWRQIDAQYARAEHLAPIAIACARFALQSMLNAIETDQIEHLDTPTHALHEAPITVRRLVIDAHHLSLVAYEDGKTGVYRNLVHAFVDALNTVAAELLLDNHIADAETDLSALSGAADFLAAVTDTTTGDWIAIKRWTNVCEDVSFGRPHKTGADPQT